MYYHELTKAWAELTGPGAQFELTALAGDDETLVYKNAPSHLGQIWQMTQSLGEQTYLIYEEERYSYADAHACVSSIQTWILSRGVLKGDRVAIAMRNYPEWLLIYWACTSLGIIVVGLNAWWVEGELDAALENASPKIVFADGERISRITKGSHYNQIADLVSVRSNNTENEHWIPWESVISHAPPAEYPELHGEEVACLFYTSGTSGAPKGATLTHRGCVTNIFNVLFAGLTQQTAKTLALPSVTAEVSPPPPVALLTTPLFHVTANNCGAHIATILGGTIVLMHRWDPGMALELIERERVTTMSGVPVMSRELLDHPDVHKRDISSLQNLAGGGAPLQLDVL